ncbi:cyanophycinase [Singulisphaera acidiphila]|uniref:Cyanophycinase n=1 Tax=Singulisphaera acidiphila (strain ATCC BAA-1392 / DSM 18658 / VKM B-2454 / MOB10) TaxID=886293 RepID=L0D764_SINAD|nr:cyanophycinase [Singulisphaera acidiphila]AGA25244.1 cyanophycinase [Singulisphaera acidiphila DSM 18658]
MSIHPPRDRNGRRLPPTVHVVLRATILAGAGVVAVLWCGVSLYQRMQPKPETSAIELVSVAIEPAAIQVVQHHSGGKLMICGGGKLPPAIRNEFCKLAGGPRARIVVIPTAKIKADQPDYLANVLAEWKDCEADSVQLLHTRSRETANDPSFFQALTKATGVWLTGGNQVFLTDTYLGTAVQEQLKAVLARGGVIAGTSAGAAVMSGVMITGGRDKPRVGQGFDFIKGAVIDQHFLKRNRMDRLIGALSLHPNLVGLGIDEETALVVDVREHHLSVIGASYVVACVPDSHHKSVSLKFLKSGDMTAMSALMKPVEDATAGVNGDETAGLTVGSL